MNPSVEELAFDIPTAIKQSFLLTWEGSNDIFLKGRRFYVINFLHVELDSLNT